MNAVKILQILSLSSLSALGIFFLLSIWEVIPLEMDLSGKIMLSLFVFFIATTFALEILRKEKMKSQ